MSRVLALDVGTQTIGVAVSDPLLLFGQPVRTLARQSVVKDTAVLVQIIGEQGAQVVVVGLPYELDGSEARSARLARQIGESVREATGLPVHYVDERFTSVQAERQLIAMRASRAKRKRVIDQAAAVLILESYLRERDLAATPKDMH